MKDCGVNQLWTWDAWGHHSPCIAPTGEINTRWRNPNGELLEETAIK